MGKQLNLMKTVVTTATEALLTSFEISYLITKNKKSRTIGERQLLPTAIKI
jgi:hypothetical protein